jgi:hypothetical protein
MPSSQQPGKSNEDELRRIYQAADDLLRAQPQNPFRLPELIIELRKKGIGISWDSFTELARRFTNRASGEFFVPQYIPKFLSVYLGQRQLMRVLDPSAGVGSLLTPIVAGCAASEGVGIVKNQEQITVAEMLGEGYPIKWLHGDPRVMLDQIAGKFDLVVSAPPFGLPQFEVEIPADGKTTKVKDSLTNVIVLKSSLRLEEDGDAFFVLPNGFFRSESVQRFSEFGLFVNAIFALPKGSFLPITAIDTNLVLISRRPSDAYFVGQLDPQRDPRLLIDNFRRRKPGSVPELGRLLAPGEFVSWQTLVTSEEIERLVQRSGLKSVRLAEVVNAVTLGDRSEDGGFEELPNAVYLPLIGTSPAVTSISDLSIKPQNCAQLTVKPELAYAEFLAGFFNSPLGRKTREALQRGTFIPKITKEGLVAGTLFLPDIEIQKEVVDLQREIRDLSLRLSEFQQSLWNRPSDVSKVRKSLHSLNQKNSLESWIEILPFPLASVLWRYHATTNAEHKNSHLLNFFEAAAQFLGALMVSGFHSNPQFFEENKRNWFDTGKDNPHSLARSSFGDWVVRCQRLGKTIRQMLSSKPEDRELCLDLFKAFDSSPLEAISSKDAFSTLEKTSRYRNDWKHGGIVSPKVHAQRLTLLEEELTRFFSAIGMAFQDWWLIRPQASNYTHGLYRFSAEKLTGSRQIFKQIDVETPVVMDSNEIYFFDTTTRLPLQLVHFFRMMPSPETEEVACYFYNRLEKHGVRWVSYHFEGDAERVEPDTEIVSLIHDVEKEDA